MNGEQRTSSVAPVRGAEDGAAKKLPQPHRCNPHVDEMIDGLFEWPPNLRKPWQDFVACMRRDPTAEIDAGLKPRNSE
jgi:hypothetical protein